MDKVLTTGKVPSREEVELKRQDYLMTLKREGDTRFTKIKENMYDDIEFEFDIMVTNEQENVAVTGQNLFQVLTAIAQNPAILQDPITKALLFEYAQKIGVNPLKLEIAEGQSATMQGMQPGLQPGMQLPGQLPGGGQVPVGQGTPTATIARGMR